jgi:ferritin-like metal-binding protein YciE
MEEAASLLDATLQEEIATDRKLSALSEGSANAKGSQKKAS